MAEIKESLHKAIDWIGLKAGQCSANTELEDIKKNVELAKDRIGTALKVGEFLQKDSRIFGKLTEANKVLGEFGDALGTVQNLCKDIEALVRIRSAVRVLKDENVIYRDPDKAARAFGQLFVGFGRLCRMMGPLKPWGQFFESAGDFFVNMRGKLDPGVRWKDKFMQIERESGIPMR